MKPGSKPIRVVWSFKRKCRLDGSLLKHKARLCCHDGMQVEGQKCWDTYSPVVNWMTVRAMLSLSIIKKLHTRSIYFTLAFPQAPVETTFYMYIPSGVTIFKQVLRIL